MATYNVIRFNNGSQAGPFDSNTATPPMLNRNGSVDITAEVDDDTFAEHLTHRMPYLKSDKSNFFVGAGDPKRLLEFRAVDWGKAATDAYECDDLDIRLSISYTDGVTYSSMSSGSISDQDTTGQGMMVFYVLAEETDLIKVNVNITNDNTANPLVNCIMMDLDHRWSIVKTKHNTSSNDDNSVKDLLQRWRVRGESLEQADLINYFGMWDDLFSSSTSVDKSFYVGS